MRRDDLATGGTTRLHSYTAAFALMWPPSSGRKESAGAIPETFSDVLQYLGGILGFTQCLTNEQMHSYI